MQHVKNSPAPNAGMMDTGYANAAKLETYVSSVGTCI